LLANAGNGVASVEVAPQPVAPKAKAKTKAPAREASEVTMVRFDGAKLGQWKALAGAGVATLTHETVITVRYRKADGTEVIQRMITSDKGMLA